MRTVEETILSQYASSPVLCRLIHGMNAYIDPAADIERFYDQVFNIHSARTWGLDNWGRILVIGREIEIDEDKDVLGFLGQELPPFNQGTFNNSGVSNVWRLEDEPYRQLLLLKAMANIADCSIPCLNRLLNNFFHGRGPVYVLKTGTMQLRYIFEFWLEPFERSLMRREDIPPRPAGVGYDWWEIPPAETFGFHHSNLQPFNQGVFTGGAYVPV